MYLSDNQIIKMKIYEKIKRHIESNKKSASSVGRDYGVSQQVISNYLNGNNAMPIDFLVWYVENNPEIDLYALFNKSQQNIVKDSKSEYITKAKKSQIIDKIVSILEEEI